MEETNIDLRDTVALIDRDPMRGNYTDIKRVQTEAHHTVGQIAIGLVAQWGMVMGHPDGEDSSGKSKLRLMTPEEVVARACDTAQLLCEELHKRDWILSLPLPELTDDARAEIARKTEREQKALAGL